MSKIGDLTTGAGVQTSLDKNKLHQYILVGDIETSLPITQFVASVSGVTKIRVVGQAIVQAFSNLVGSALLGANVKVGQALPIANGGAGNTACNYSLTNAGATTPEIFGNSIDMIDTSGRNNGLVSADMVVIQDGDSQSFTDFDYLIVDATNLQDDVTNYDFYSGWNESALSIAELEEIATLELSYTDADGRLSGCIIVPGQSVERATLFASGGTVPVCVVNLP